MSLPRVKVPITLDKPRTLVLSFNAMCDVQRVLGRNPFELDGEGEVDIGSPEVIRAYLWAALKHEDPELTLEQTGDLLEQAPGGWVSAMTAVAQALEASMPEPDVVEAAAASAEGNATGSQ